MAANQAWATTLQAAFPAEFERIVRTIHTHPAQGETLQLFLDLASHINRSDVLAANGTGNPNNKKRKLDDNATASASSSNSGPSTIHRPVTIFDCKDVSVQMPTRKKLRLQLIKDENNDRSRQLSLIHPTSDEVEYALAIDQIDQVFCLPVPDKQQRQWNFCIFPKNGAVSSAGNSAEQILFTINEAAPTGANLLDYEPGSDDTYLNISEEAFNRTLKLHDRKVIRPNPREFESSISQPHRKNEKAYHVKAHRGSKEGYLFFLENGIVFGFKKPLTFFPFSDINSISYTSVLQRTFNLVITTTTGDQGAEREQDVEFGMIDQADFAGIDEYIKKHELNDASMAAQRRAKVYGVNKEKKANVNQGGQDGQGGEDEQSELQKAEQQLQDEEDEEEEDYEASGGESDGSGEDSDEEEDGYEQADGEGEGEEGEDDEDDEADAEMKEEND